MTGRSSTTSSSRVATAKVLGASYTVGLYVPCLECPPFTESRIVDRVAIPNRPPAPEPEPKDFTVPGLYDLTIESVTFDGQDLKVMTKEGITFRHHACCCSELESNLPDQEDPCHNSPH